MIRQVPDPILSTPCDPVDIATITEALLKADFEYLAALLQSTENGIAIAANQGGLSRRMFVSRDSNHNYFAIINPVITKTFGDPVEVEYAEGCLSIPHFEAKEGLLRFPKIRVDYWIYPFMIQVTGRTVEGIEAQMFQHEIDHLDGFTIQDKVIKD